MKKSIKMETFIAPLTKHQMHEFLADNLSEKMLNNFDDIHATQFIPPQSSGETFDLGISESPLVLNVQGTGFYRTNYDAENWNRLQAALSEDFTQISINNRAAIIGDAFYLAQAGLLDYSVPLGLATYLSSETHYTPFSEGMADLLDVSQIFSSKAVQANYDSILEAQYARIGLAEDPEATFMDGLFQWRLIRLALARSLPAFVEDAVSVFSDYMADSSVNPVNREARYVNMSKESK